MWPLGLHHVRKVVKQNKYSEDRLRSNIAQFEEDKE